MSIFSTIKKAFGFPEEYEDSEYSGDDTTEVADLSESSVADESSSVNTEEELPEADTAGLSGAIFNSVIELFNATQPDFIKECLSQPAQQQYILNRMNDDVKALLEKEIILARKRGERLWQAERKKLSGALETIKADFNAIKSQRDEFRNAQLSETRQKRALKDRIKDLETQIATLEAEKEQFQLENRSMVNKLRVANVRSSCTGDEETEIMRLATENVKLQDNINLLRDKLTASDSEIKQLRSDLESEADIEQLKEIEDQIKQFEVIKEKKDAKIASLNKANKQKDHDIAQLKTIISEHEQVTQTLRDEITSLRNTIEANLRSHAISENELKLKLEKQSAENNPELASEPRQDYGKSSDTIVESKQPSDVKISAIDELMDNTDWFVAPTPTPIKKTDIDDNFGYKEPVRKPTHDNDNQLSLWS